MYAEMIGPNGECEAWVHMSVYDRLIAPCVNAKIINEVLFAIIQTFMVLLIVWYFSETPSRLNRVRKMRRVRHKHNV